MKRRYSEQAMTELDDAIVAGNLERVMELVEGGKAGITNLECGIAVKHNQMEILEYFLSKFPNAVQVISLGLSVAIQEINLEAIRMITSSLRDNENQYSDCDLDSVIICAIQDVIGSVSSTTKKINMIKIIVKNYCCKKH